jgi:hypothetical protein
MDPIYLLAIVRKRRDTTSKMTRVAKCSFERDATAGTLKFGESWRLEIYDNPLPSLMDLVFIRLSTDPGIRSAEALAERMVSGLSLASGVEWEREACGPIDSDDAVLMRVKMEVLTLGDHRR